MAARSPWQDSREGSSDPSAVLDMQMDDLEGAETDDSADYGPGRSQDIGATKRPASKFEEFQQSMRENVTSMMWQSGKQRVAQAWSLYGNIDILRPYFDVEPQELQKRLIYSLIPQKPTSQRQRVPRELYGPLMVIFTLIALLLFQMKSSDHRVEEGTLMGTAFVVCFTYWFGAASFVWFLSYVCNVHMTYLQILSMMGYALFSHCIVLFLGTVLHTAHDHALFYFLWTLLGGLSAIKMGCIILSRASGKTERIVVIAVLTLLHMLFLLYLHFAYHSTVEEVSEALRGDAVVPRPLGTLPAAAGGDAVPAVAKKMVDITMKPVVEAIQKGSLNKSVEHLVRRAVVSAASRVNGTLAL